MHVIGCDCHVCKYVSNTYMLGIPYVCVYMDVLPRRMAVISDCVRCTRCLHTLSALPALVEIASRSRVSELLVASNCRKAGRQTLMLASVLISTDRTSGALVLLVLGL